MSRYRRFGKRSPWLAGILNFFVWGTGYLYAGRRSFLGVSLLVFAATVFLGVPALASDPLRAASLLLAAWLAVSTALAWDAYSEVKGNEKGKGRGRLRTG